MLWNSWCLRAYNLPRGNNFTEGKFCEALQQNFKNSLITAGRHQVLVVIGCVEVLTASNNWQLELLYVILRWSTSIILIFLF